MPDGKLFNRTRRIALKSIGLLGGLAAARQLQASHTETHFENSAAHRIVYQCNKADPEYLQHILFSAGELIRKYGDDVEVVIATFGDLEKGILIASLFFLSTVIPSVMTLNNLSKSKCFLTSSNTSI